MKMPSVDLPAIRRFLPTWTKFFLVTDTTEVSGQIPELPFTCPLELHAQYGIKEIQAAFGRANP